MGKISNYTRVLKAKLQDVFAIDSTDNNVTTTKSVTVEQIGDAICGEQVHSDLETDDQTIIGGINENKDKVGDLSSLTTTNKDSLVDAVNEVDGKITTATTVSSGSITPNTGYTVVNSSVKKIGNLVAVSFVIKATTAITSRQTIANIANGFRPTQNEWYTFSGSSIVNGTSNRIITGLITSSGDIMVGDGIEPAGQSVIEFRGSCTYYTA